MSLDTLLIGMEEPVATRDDCVSVAQKDRHSGAGEMALQRSGSIRAGEG